MPRAAPVPWLRRWADLLDNRFVVPGTEIRFGLDPILSLVPGVGDLVSPVFALVLLVQGVYQRVPKVILLRMLLNALFDGLIGIVPVAGTVADVFWRANTRNLALLEAYAQPGRQPTAGDYAFIWAVAAVFGMLAAAIVFGAVGLLLWMIETVR